MLTRPGATFELARQVQIGTAGLGDVFAFCSGLYFRGKLAYAQRFAKPPAGIEGVQIITPSRGLVPVTTLVGAGELLEFASVPVESGQPLFTYPLQAAAAALARLGSFQVVLLGSVATGKYLDTLLPVFGERLWFPAEFVGRGDMSRGALLLRSVAANRELDYQPADAIKSKPRTARKNAPRVADNPDGLTC